MTGIDTNMTDSPLSSGRPAGPGAPGRPLPGAARAQWLQSVCTVCLARALLLAIALVGTASVLSLAFLALAADGFGAVDAAALALFALPTAWIGWSTGHAALGFVGRRLGWRPGGLAQPEPGSPLVTRTAIALPVYEEDCEAWAANLQAMGEDLAARGHGGEFDIFVLSDTRDDAVAAREERMRDLLARRLPMAVHYRRREENTGKKAGNVADFARRWAGRYDYMLVLDADSLMDGATVVELVRTMQSNPGAGLIQTAPRLARRRSLFARLQQFSAALMGPMAATGQALWQGGDGNFWGHNALIRCSAWTECAHLPRLAGRAPFGGPIMSHDFVEAALLRRGGWGVWMLPDLGGSWEETPPGLLSHLTRDRRWCQGNLQHMRVLAWPKLHPISRLHLVLGIATYAVAPLWLALVLGGAILGLTGDLHFDPFLASGALAASATLLFAPKMLALLDVLLDRTRRRAMGGGLPVAFSTLAETAMTIFLAPAVLFFHARFLLELLAGRVGGWDRQNRGETVPSWSELFVWCRLHLAGAAALAALAVTVAPGGLDVWLMLPAAGWALVPAIAWATAHPRVAGRTVLLFAVPEELQRVEIIARAEALQVALKAPTHHESPQPRGDLAGGSVGSRVA